MRTRRNADRPGIADADELGFENSIIIECLNTMVVPVRDVHKALRIDRDGMWGVKLPRRRSPLPPGLDVHTVLIELCNPGVVVTIGDKNISVRIPSHIGRPVETVPGGA